MRLSLLRSFTLDGIPSLLTSFLSFLGFENELNAFLKQCGVDAPHISDKRSWGHFEEFYCDIVHDCLLSYENKNKPLKHINNAVVAVKKVQFSPAQIIHDPLTASTGMEWVFFKNEREVFRLLLTYGSKPALRDALDQPKPPQTPNLPPR